jgi:hypothetical protein
LKPEVNLRNLQRRKSYFTENTLRNQDTYHKAKFVSEKIAVCFGNYAKTNKRVCVCVCVYINRKWGKNPRDTLKEGYFHCAGISLSGIRGICHMPLSVNYNTCCYRRYCISTVTSILTSILPVTGTHGLLTPSVNTVSVTITWLVQLLWLSNGRNRIG